MRSLPLEFTSDAGARGVSDQFMFGDALLINPVTTEGATQRTVYLPAGTGWVDFWTGKGAKGGQSITADAPLDKMPIYVRAGSIVPYGSRAEFASAARDPTEWGCRSTVDSAAEDEGDTMIMSTARSLSYQCGTIKPRNSRSDRQVGSRRKFVGPSHRKMSDGRHRNCADVGR